MIDFDSGPPELKNRFSLNCQFALPCAGQLWRELPDSEKSAYKQQHKLARRQYEADLALARAAFRDNGSGAAAVALSASASTL